MAAKNKLDPGDLLLLRVIKHKIVQSGRMTPYICVKNLQDDRSLYPLREAVRTTDGDLNFVFTHRISRLVEAKRLFPYQRGAKTVYTLEPIKKGEK